MPSASTVDLHTPGRLYFRNCHGAAFYFSRRDALHEQKIERKPAQPTRFYARVETAEGIKEFGISADLKALPTVAGFEVRPAPPAR